MTTEFDLLSVLPSGFEGAEKKLEIDFPSDPTDTVGLRAIAREHWERILELIKCQIVNCTSNDYFDAYVLSESSLFVYPHKIIIKTCGTTILLKCLEPLAAMTKEQCGLSPDFLFFSRKNYRFPDRQVFPHTSYKDEIAALNHIFPGYAMSFGPTNDEHWNLFFSDLIPPKERLSGKDQTLEILMQELDAETMQQFYRGPNFIDGKEVTRSSGIADLIPGAIIDELSFDPCGYSCNGLLDQYYFTIHITPEPACSYVSFETNLPRSDYTSLINHVVETFKPGKWSVTVFSDVESMPGNSLSSFDAKALERNSFNLRYRSWSEFENPYTLKYAYYTAKEATEGN